MADPPEIDMDRDGAVPKHLFKYLSYRQDFFEELLLRITPPKEFDDPFEGILTRESYLYFLEHGPFRTEAEREDALTKFSKDHWEREATYIGIKEWGVISLTENRDSLLMWAHYADSHKGILIEFNTIGSGTTTHSFFDGEVDTSRSLITKIRSNPVSYPPGRKRWSVKPTTKDQLDNFATFYHFTKSEEWAYEKEHRMFLNYDKLSGLQEKAGMHFIKIPEEVIAKIYIGCRAIYEEEILNSFLQAKERNPKLEHVTIFESSIDENDFKINYKEVCGE